MGKSAEICWRGRWRAIEIKYINRSYPVSIDAYGASGERKSRTGGCVGAGGQCFRRGTSQGESVAGQSGGYIEKVWRFDAGRRHVCAGCSGSALSSARVLRRLPALYVAEVDATSSLKLPDIFLKEDRQTLDAITVTGRTVTYNAEGYVANIAANKQLQQLPLDRMLAFLPGMYVDREKMKVYMREISTVYINDREVHLDGQELIDHLKAYDGKNIQKIEVIVNNGVEHAASNFGAASIRITTVKVVEGGMFSLGREPVIARLTNVTAILGAISCGVMANCRWSLAQALIRMPKLMYRVVRQLNILIPAWRP